MKKFHELQVVIDEKKGTTRGTPINIDDISVVTPLLPTPKGERHSIRMRGGERFTVEGAYEIVRDMLMNLDAGEPEPQKAPRKR